MIFTFLCAPFFTNGQSEFADSLFSAGDYNYAKLEYERVVFASTNRDVINNALLKKGYCLKNLGDYSEAYKTIERANLFGNNDTVNYIMRSEIALNAYLAGEYIVALNQILQIDYFTKDQEKKDQILFLKILCLNELQRWNEAKEIFTEYAKINDLQNDPNEVYSFLEKPKIRDPKKAEKLSYILPGVGQMYAGYFGKGLFSSLTQLVLVSFGAYSIYEGYFFTGAFTGIGLFYAFYSGGIRHARYLAEKKNAEKVEKYNARVRKVILDNEQKNNNN
ncbi:MAG: tetratricopeptide repeat protein [Bacteroidota bacterium]